MSSSILFSFIEVGTFNSRCFLTTLDRIRTDFQPWKSAPVDWHTTAPHVFLCRKVDIAGLSTSMELASATCDWDRSNRDRAGGFKYECYIYIYILPPCFGCSKIANIEVETNSHDHLLAWILIHSIHLPPSHVLKQLLHRSGHPTKDF